MESFKLVLPEHLNHYGYLFGGNMLKWIDEIAWIAASRDYPGCKFVTIGMDRVEFRRSVRQGSVIRFEATQAERGRTSIRYNATAYCDHIETGEEETVFSTQVTFVCLDDDGVKRPLAEAGA